MVNFFSTRSVKHQEWRLALARDQLIQRQQIYADYLAEVQRLTGEAIFRTLDVPKDVQALDRLVAQMTLVSPSSVMNGARELRRHLLRARPAEGDREAPSFAELSATFVEAAKSDLRSYRDDA